MSELITSFAEQLDKSNQSKRKKGGQPGNHNARKTTVPNLKDARELLVDTLASPPAMKKRGAPYGNQNARTFGFYSRKLPLAQLQGLDATTVRSVEDEIELMRVFSRNVAELGAKVNTLDEAKSVLNALSKSTGSINRLVRTHVHIPALDLDPSAMLRKALLELELEWPELRRFNHQYRTPDEIKAKEEESAAWMASHPEIQNDSSNQIFPSP